MRREGIAVTAMAWTTVACRGHAGGESTTASDGEAPAPGGTNSAGDGGATSTSACESTSSCPGMTCPTSLDGTLDGTLDGDAWRDVCAATLLPGVEVTCWVWGS
jgi:hypothetical protein